MLKNAYSKLIRSGSARLLKFYNFNPKFSFDQYKDRPKRHFMLYYKFVEDMNYKRSIIKDIFSPPSRRTFEID